MIDGMRPGKRITGYQPVFFRPDMGRLPVIRLAVVLLFLASRPALGQTRLAEVSAALNVAALKPSAQATIAVVLDVKEGFHAQSHVPLEENLIPCRVTL